MLITVTTDTPVLNSLISQNFGRCAFFILFDEDKNSTEIVQNPFANSMGVGAGIQLARLLIDKGADFVITNRMGAGPFRLLSSANVEVYQCTGLTAIKAAELLVKNELPALNMPSVENGLKFRKRFRNNIKD
jgi:predicted Fe-Mo cluster-binding NifX family protein